MRNTKKHTHLRIVKANAPAYPNAASRRYYTEKLLDILTAVVSGAGLTVAMVFLVTLA